MMNDKRDPKRNVIDVYIDDEQERYKQQNNKLKAKVLQLSLH